MKKLATIFMIVMSLMFNITAFAFDYNTETMYVGINAEYPPFEYIENGEYKGFDIELMQYLGERKNFNVEFVDMSFDEMLAAVQTGKVDCAISGICITEERKLHLEFTDAYMDCNVTYVENGETVHSEESYAIALAKDTKFDYMLNSAIADAKQAKIPQLAEKYGIIFDAETGYYEYSIGQINTTTDQNQEVSTEGTKIYFVSTGITESDKADKQIVCTALACRLDYCGYTGSSVTVNEFGEFVVGFDYILQEEEVTSLANVLCDPFELQFVDSNGNIVMRGSTGVSKAKTQYDQNYGYYVELELTAQGRKEFKDATEKISKMENNSLSIMLDDSIISAPQVAETIDSDSVIISGSFTEESANSLADIINSGRLPYSLKLKENLSESDAEQISLFTDVSASHWAHTYIIDMADKGIITGYGNGLFGPNDQITRAQFATMLCRAAEIKINTSAPTFFDVSSSDWFAPYVEAAKPYINGYNNNSYFKPNTNANREDIAVALVKYKKYDISGYNEDELKSKFNDWQEISAEARPYVSAAVKHGLINGYDDNTFRGQANITRAEAATLFWKMLQ